MVIHVKHVKSNKDTHQNSAERLSSFDAIRIGETEVAYFVLLMCTYNDNTRQTCQIKQDYTSRFL